jgi:hypothetical protein
MGPREMRSSYDEHTGRMARRLSARPDVAVDANPDHP